MSRAAGAPGRTFPWKRVIQGFVSLIIVVGIFVGIMPLIADYEDVWATIADMTAIELGGLVLVGLWNLATPSVSPGGAQLDRRPRRLLPGAADLRIADHAGWRGSRRARLRRCADDRARRGHQGPGGGGHPRVPSHHLSPPHPLGIVSYVIWRVNRSWRLSKEERLAMAGCAYGLEPEPEPA